MIGCTQAVERLWAYLDGELGEVDRDRVDEHLALCRRCCGELEFARRLRGLLASAAAPHLPPDVDRRLTAFLDELEEPTWDRAP